MNIKIIVNKKLHKLPVHVDSYEKLIKQVQELYPKMQQVIVWLMINPENPLIHIADQDQFYKAKKMYQDAQSPSIKFLVTETLQADQVIKESWPLLNQSVVIPFQNNTDKMNQTQVQEQKDASVQNHPVQTDQQQQVKPTIDHQETQVKVQQNDSAQNTFEQESSLVTQVQRIIDERLKHYNLIAKPFQYMALIWEDNFKVNEGEKLNLAIKIKNTGTNQWTNAHLVCADLGIDAKVGQTQSNCEASVKFEVLAPKKFGLNHYDFQLIEVGEQQKEPGCVIGDPIRISIDVIKSIYKDPLKAKVETLLGLFPQKGYKFLEEFVKKQGIQKSPDELTEILLNQ